MSLILPEGYRPNLGKRATLAAIPRIKHQFQECLADNLNLQRASALLAVRADTGINDDLNGVEKPVEFDVKALAKRAQVVQSLAKWKRVVLSEYGFSPGEGIWTDMNALRPEEPALDNLHSIYVDQWDWERVMAKDERNVDFLKDIVRRIYDAVKQVEKMAYRTYGLRRSLPKDISFVTTEELERNFPNQSRKERENAIAKELGAVFLVGIGAPLNDGESHDGRAPDYDDWITMNEMGGRGLNGDIILWNPVLDMSFELSSMGIRVDQDALVKQLKIREASERLQLPFHKLLMEGKLYQTIGGGIGQSRLCMFILKKAHIGEVQASEWPQEHVDALRAHGIPLLWPPNLLQ